MEEVQERVNLGSVGESVEGSTPVYEVVLIRPGVANGIQFSAEVLKQSVDLWEGATSFVDHGDFLGWSPRKVRDIAGVISGCRYDEERGVVGRLSLNGAQPWLDQFLRTICRDREKGLPVPDVGLSADMTLQRRKGECVAILKVHSVDVVFNPAAGGAFERVLEGMRTREVGNGMTEERVRYDAGSEIVSQHPDRSSSEEEPQQGDRVGQGEQISTSQVSTSIAPAAQAPWDQGIGDLQRLQCSVVLDTVLRANADIPEPLTRSIVGRFQGQVFSAQDLEGAVRDARKMWADLIQEGVIQGSGQAREGAHRDAPLHANSVRTWDSMDRIQMAFDRLMGLEIPGEHSDLPRLSGIREMYLMLTGDHDFHGVLYPERVSFANVTTSTVTSVVKNALNKVLLKSYEIRPQWWKPVAYEEDFNTLQTVTWITLGGIADLDTVTEGNAYTEKAWSDNEETTSWTKKGNYVGVTLEAIDRDDVAAIRQLPRKIGYAAAKTLSAAVAALFTAQSGTGPDLSDSKALFHADHSNLGTTALSAAEWDAVIVAVYQQAEATSTRRIGARPRHILVPIELEKTALVIVGSIGEPGTGDNDINVRRGSASVIAVPEWTDTNNWAAACDPLDVQSVCIGYRFGRAPELFVADNELTGSMFTNDEMRIKVRFFYAVGIGDYRGLYKENVA